MKILVVNGSPRGKKGNTYILQEAFVKGAKAAGAQVEEVYLHKLKINPCIGCFNCWVKTPGICVHKDDQASLLDKCKWADVLALATPVYVDGVTGQTKIFLDRLIPLSKPEFILVQDHCRHPSLLERKWQFLLISNCGFHELDNFDALVFHCKKMCLNLGSEYLGHLLRPHGPLLAYQEAFGEKVTYVLQAAEKAGETVGSCGVLSSQTMDQVSREIISKSDYVKLVNEFWKMEKKNGLGKNE